MNKLTMEEVFQAICKERFHQDEKYGEQKPQSLPGFLLVARHELAEAETGWMKSIKVGRDSPLCELLQVAAVCVAALERYGVEGCPTSTNDQEIKYLDPL